MSGRPSPGLAFTIVCDNGFALGLYTHKDPKMGELVWIAEGFWTEEPTIDEIASATWAWCVFFPLATALKRRIVFPVGRASIPTALVEFPVMRAGSRQQGWFLVRGGDIDNCLSEAATDPVTPPRILVNDTRLRAMLVTGWRPEDLW